jgi:density-regulated protein DRP1
LDLKKVAKKFAGKYACGSSVVKEDNTGIEEIDIQGDFVDDLITYIPKEFPEVNHLFHYALFNLFLL